MSANDIQVAGSLDSRGKFLRHLHNPKTREWIESNVIRLPFCGCWIWNKSATARGGYGQVSYGSYGTEKAHRLSFAAFVGDCSGKFVCHSCDIPACVNPNHLFLGSALDNHLDMVNKGRGNYAKAAKQRRQLSADQVREIRASKLSQVELAAIYGMSAPVMGQVRRKVLYKDVV